MSRTALAQTATSHEHAEVAEARWCFRCFAIEDAPNSERAELPESLAEERAQEKCVGEGGHFWELP